MTPEELAARREANRLRMAEWRAANPDSVKRRNKLTYTAKIRLRQHHEAEFQAYKASYVAAGLKPYAAQSKALTRLCQAHPDEWSQIRQEVFG